MYKNKYKKISRMEVDDLKVNATELARRNGLSAETMRKRAKGVEPQKIRKKRGSKIDKFKDIVNEKVDNYAANATDIYHFIQKKHNYDGSYDLVKNYVREYKAESMRKATIRVETNPGLQAQVDWKEDFKFISKNGEQFKINIFLYVLSYSRMRYIELTTDRKQATLFQCLIHAFEYTGGVPSEIWFDNMATVVDSHDINTGIVTFNQKFLIFAKDASFTPVACRPYRPQTKGRAECTAKLMNRLRPYNCEFQTLNELSNIVRELNEDINLEVSQATKQRPRDLLEKEKEYFIPLIPIQIRESYQAAKLYKVSLESMITYHGKKYSVPVRYISKKLCVEEKDDNLHIYYNLELVSIHKIIENKKFNYRKEDVKEILKSDICKRLNDNELEDKAISYMKKYDEVK